MSPKKWPRGRAGVYVTGVILVGVFVLAQAVLHLSSAPFDVRWIALAALTLVSGTASIQLRSVQATISLSEIFVFTTVILFGRDAGTVTVVLDAFVISLSIARKQRELYRLLFNIAAPAVSVWVAAQTFFALLGSAPLAYVSRRVELTELAGPLLAFTVIYFLLNSWLIAFAISLEERKPAFQIWRNSLLWVSIDFFGGASVAALIVGYKPGFDPSLLVVVVPIILVLHFTFKTAINRVQDANIHLAKVNRLYFATIETLAMAIDAKDQVTHGHIRRVQTYAVGLAKALDLRSEDQIKAIEAAALLHDMGKLAVPEFILNKPGPLTTIEFERMKTHSSVGAEILGAIEFPYPVVPIVRHHHENWDGSGYPDGLKGTEIPIGARILSVVDCFDALTSDRPYRPKLADMEAIHILLERRGTMYDPLIVDTFIRVHASISSQPAQTDVADRQQPALAAIAEAATVRSGIEEEERANSAQSIHMLAFYELGRALAGQQMPARDVAELVGQHLRRVLTANVYAFFLCDHDTNELRILHSLGNSSELLSGLVIPVGARLSGWVAANRGTIVNSDPVLDLGEIARQFQPPLRNSLSTAIVADTMLAGVLTLYSERRFSQDDARVLEVIARHVARAFASAAELERRKSLLTDAVTGLPSAEYVRDLIETEIAASLHGGQTTSMILVDVDRRKALNRRAGRKTGDEVLGLVSSVVRAALRTTDVLSRSNSDELIIALPQTDRVTASAIAKRIQSCLRTRFDLLDTRVSVAVATAPQDGLSFNSLVAAAATELRREPSSEPPPDVII